MEREKIRGISRHWLEFKKKGNVVSRNFLLIHYLPLTKYVASTIPVFNPGLYSYEDLVSWGVVGLLDALSRFNPAQGVKFETYAISRIRGEIMDNLRRLNFPYRWRKRKIFEKTFLQLSQKLGRTPTDEEMTKALGVEGKKYRAWLAYLVPVSLISLEEFIGGEEMLFVKTEQIDNPVEALEKDERLEKLTRALLVLPERERLVLTLYYYEGLTINEIGEVMGLTKGRISQLHGHAISSLRLALGVTLNKKTLSSDTLTEKRKNETLERTV